MYLQDYIYKTILHVYTVYTYKLLERLHYTSKMHSYIRLQYIYIYAVNVKTNLFLCLKMAFSEKNRLLIQYLHIEIIIFHVRELN